MHKLLQRQIKKSFGKDFDIESCDENLKKLFENISEMYDHNDSQRKSLEQIITINTDELKEAKDELSLLLEEQKKENKSVSNIFSQYKGAMDEALIINITDLNGNLKYVNNKFCELTLFNKDELVGNHYSILQNSNFNEDFQNNSFLESIRLKNLWSGVIKGIKKNGEEYYVKSTILPLLDEDGNTIEYISLNDDITEMIFFQKKLQVQKERINTIFNSQEDITVIVKPGAGIVDANSKFYNTFNFKSLEEYKNKYRCFSELFIETSIISDEQIKLGNDWFGNFLEKVKEFDSKISYKDEKNDYIFRIYSKKILLENEEHYLASLANITELENARKKAEIAEKAKSTFLANMSHEIRTPLNSIIGFSNILCEADLNEINLKHSKIISRSATSLLEIINDVLDISKIESGKLELVEDSFSLSEFIKNIVDLFSIRASEKNINFEYCLDERVPNYIFGDETRLRQVIFNLLSNAIKFTKSSGKVHFCINLIEQSKDLVKINFKIEDTGIGISADNIEKIFKPFSQADDRISRDYGGTGLGLTICSDIIKLMNSRIKVDSTLGKGSSFYFDLEFKIDNSEIKLIEDKHLDVLVQNSNPMHILVAEDNTNNILLIEILLENLNASFVITQNGEEAFEEFKKSNFDLILMDVNMPIMDGLTATKLIKAYEKENNLKNTPIVALTANSIVGDREKYLANGMDDYLSKPIIFDDLKQILHKYGSKN